MSIGYMLAAAQRGGAVGSVLHGAYGDYYEQMVCLRALQRRRPDLKIFQFYGSESRRRELAVFDTSYAEADLPATAIDTTPVDAFVQFQIHDQDLHREVLDHLSAKTRAKFDYQHNLKPWAVLRDIYRPGETTCDLGLSPLGQARLPACMEQNGLDPHVFTRPTIGFLWRYRQPGGPIAARGQASEQQVLRTKSELLARLAAEYGATVIVAGMGVRTTEQNRERTDGKFTERRLTLSDASTVYLRGLSWGLELEILRRCTICIVMASGFSEALLMKRRGPTVLIDPPPMYCLKLWRNRMPLFGAMRPSHAWFYLRPHSAQRVLSFMRRHGYLPPRDAAPDHLLTQAGA